MLLFFFFFPFFSLGPHSQHMEVPRLGVQSELQLLAYATATTTSDPSSQQLPHSSRQRLILNPPSEARDQTSNLMVTSRVHFHCAMTGTPRIQFITAVAAVAAVATLAQERPHAKGVTKKKKRKKRKRTYCWLTFSDLFPSLHITHMHPAFSTE